MLFPSTSYDVDLFNNAYDNIALVANNIWAYNNHDDPYRKLNQKLWIKICKLDQNHSIVKSKTGMFVSDVIPNSRLSKYGNYTYDNERESLYTRDKSDVLHESIGNNMNTLKDSWSYSNANRRGFYHLKDSKSLPFDKVLSSVEFDCSGFGFNEEYENYRRLPYSINNVAEVELKRKISHNAIINIWRNDNIEHMLSHQVDHKKSKKCRNAQKGYDESVATCNLQQPTVILPKERYREDRCKCRTKIAGPILRAEVPEFFPKKSCREENCISISRQYFPINASRIFHRMAVAVPASSSQTARQNIRIPLMTSPLMKPSQWLARSSPSLQIQVPVCTLAPSAFPPIQSIYPIVQNPIQLHEKIIQPNEIYSSVITEQHSTSAKHFRQCKNKYQHVDFKNFILLFIIGIPADY